MTTTGIRIDPNTLLDARRELSRHEASLRAVCVHPPETGPTTALTAGVLDRVAVTVGAVADDLRGLAGALDRLVDDLADQDDRVSATFDQLARRSVA